MSTAIFYHAGCPVCISAEQTILDSLNPQIKVTNIHLGEQADHYEIAIKHGVKSVPALVIDEQVFHINFGASMDDLK